MQHYSLRHKNQCNTCVGISANVEKLEKNSNFQTENQCNTTRRNTKINATPVLVVRKSMQNSVSSKRALYSFGRIIHKEKTPWVRLTQNTSMPSFECDLRKIGFNIALIFDKCISLSSQQPIRAPWIHSDSHSFTCIHLESPGSPGFTWIHQDP